MAFKNPVCRKCTTSKMHARPPRKWRAILKDYIFLLQFRSWNKNKKSVSFWISNCDVNFSCDCSNMCFQAMNLFCAKAWYSISFFNIEWEMLPWHVSHNLWYQNCNNLHYLRYDLNQKIFRVNSFRAFHRRSKHICREMLIAKENLH